MNTRSFSTIGIVLKRVNVGETDRIVNILTQEFGKITVVAKGVRKMASTKRAFLEPGNIIQAYLIKTKSLPLLTQAKLIADCSKMEQSLQAFRQLTQLLEIYEKLFVEVEIESDIYASLLSLRKQIILGKAPAIKVRDILGEVIVKMGFQQPTESKYRTITQYIQALSDSKINSYNYLRVKI